MLSEHVRMWGTAEINNAPFVELSSQLLDTVRRLAGHVIGIIEVGGLLLPLFYTLSAEVLHYISCVLLGISTVGISVNPRKTFEHRWLTSNGILTTNYQS